MFDMDATIAHRPLSKLDKVRRFLGRTRNRHASRIFVAWHDATRLSRSIKAARAALAPEVLAALRTPPATRSGAQIDAISDLVQGFKFARMLPPQSLLACCRYMTVDVLSANRALPRSGMDAHGFYVVLSGGVEVAYGQLGQTLADCVRALTLRLYDEDSESAASEDGQVAAAERDEVDGQRSSSCSEEGEMSTDDVFGRLLDHDTPPDLDPVLLRQHWRMTSTQLAQLARATGTSTAARLSRSASARASPERQLSERPSVSQALFGAALPESVAQTNTSLLTAGQVFAGSKLAAWSDRVPGWDPPIQAFAALAAPDSVAAVLVLPGAIVQEAVQCMDQAHTLSIMDMCCRLSSLRHVGVSELARLAKYTTEHHFDRGHELLRQHHDISYVHMLIDGAVELSAFVGAPVAAAAAARRTLDGHCSLTESVGSHGPHNADEVRAVLGVRVGPCVLGDDVVRGGDRRSFVTVVTLQPCTVLTVPAPVYKSCMEGLTLQLLEQLRVQTQSAGVLRHAAAEVQQFRHEETTTRDDMIRFSYGSRSLPLALSHETPSTTPAKWVPSSATHGLFLDCITIGRGEVGGFESPEERLERLRDAVKLRLIGERGGLAQLVMQAKANPGFQIGSGFFDFCTKVEGAAMESLFHASKLPEILSEMHEALDCKALQTLAAMLEEIGALPAAPEPMRPHNLFQIRSSSVAATRADGLRRDKLESVDLIHPNSLAARPVSDAKLVDYCALLLVCVDTATGQSTENMTAHAAFLDELYMHWLDLCGAERLVTFVRRSIHQVAVVVEVPEGAERREAVLTACRLAHAFVASAEAKLSAARSAYLHHWVKIAVASGPIVCISSHGRFVAALEGATVQTAARLLAEAHSCTHGHVTVLADCAQHHVTDATLCSSFGSGWRLHHQHVVRSDVAARDGRHAPSDLLRPALDASPCDTPKLGEVAPQCMWAPEPRTGSVVAPPPAARSRSPQGGKARQRRLFDQLVDRATSGLAEPAELDREDARNSGAAAGGVDHPQRLLCAPPVSPEASFNAFLVSPSPPNPNGPHLESSVRSDQRRGASPPTPRGRSALTDRLAHDDEGGHADRRARSPPRGRSPVTSPPPSSGRGDSITNGSPIVGHLSRSLGSVQAYRHSRRPSGSPASDRRRSSTPPTSYPLLDTVAAVTADSVPAAPSGVACADTAGQHRVSFEAESQNPAGCHRCGSQSKSFRGRSLPPALSIPRPSAPSQGLGTCSVNITHGRRRLRLSESVHARQAAREAAAKPMTPTQRVHRVKVSNKLAALLDPDRVVTGYQRLMSFAAVKTPMDARKQLWQEMGAEYGLAPRYSVALEARGTRQSLPPVRSVDFRARQHRAMMEAYHDGAQDMADIVSMPHAKRLLDTDLDTVLMTDMSSNYDAALFKVDKELAAIRDGIAPGLRQILATQEPGDGMPGAQPLRTGRAAPRQGGHNHTRSVSFDSEAAGSGAPAGMLRRQHASTGLERALSGADGQQVKRVEGRRAPRRESSRGKDCGEHSTCTAPRLLDHHVARLGTDTVRLELTGLNASELPPLTKLRWLQCAALSFNQLTAWPDMPVLGAMHSLNLARNRLCAIPPDIAATLPNLKNLNLSCNTIRTVPTGVGDLANLCTLNVSHNEIEELPETVSSLICCHALDVSHNRLAALPASIGTVQSLRRLNASFNALTTVPPAVAALTGLEELCWAGNELQQFPPSVLACLTRLTRLDLHKNRLLTLDLADNEQDGHMTKADAVVCQHDGDRVAALMALLGRLEAEQAAAAGLGPGQAPGAAEMQAASLRQRWTAVQEYGNGELACLPNLRQVDLRHNQLARIPRCLPPCLEALYIADNALYEIPPWFCDRASSLLFLDAHINSIVTLPREIVRLRSLRMLGLAHNPVCIGGGRLATALAAGEAAGTVLDTVSHMSHAQWLDELRCVRGALGTREMHRW